MSYKNFNQINLKNLIRIQKSEKKRNIWREKNFNEYYHEYDEWMIYLMFWKVFWDFSQIFVVDV